MEEANYSTGDYYHYSYDAVGNRKTQEKLINNILTSDSYNYDHANHLKFVNGVEHFWDDNGNLLDDGVNAYQYNAANRLTAFGPIGQTPTSTYEYNGLGDRLQETVNGQTTTFTMDLNAGLTQALSDGTNNYIYGLDRIAQTQGSTTEYFLGDALGSVMQLTNTTGAITYKRAYDPYGVVTSTSGSSQTPFGFTNEYTSNDLVYLRARYYASDIGRFITKDSWMGDYNRPLSINHWMYVEGNPTNLTDSNGHSPNCPLRGEECARQRLFEIVYAESPNNGALALVRSFEDNELFNLWGNYAGRTSAKRLEWLLDATRGMPGLPVSIPGLPVHFAFDFGSDCGFREEFRDSQFYPQWYGANTEDRSNQVGHFLTAVSITYNHWDIGFIIGHEKVPDGNKVEDSIWDKMENFLSYVSVTTQEYHMFYEAAQFDEQGFYDERDELLWAILDFDDNVDYGEVSSARDGNSLQDFRLSLKGYRFAKWVRDNNNTHPSFAAFWLRSNLMSLPTVPRPPR